MYNTTNIFITWSTPVYPNGLVNYTVVVKKRYLLGDYSTPTIIEKKITNGLELLVDYMVNAYHEYVVNVTSQTSAGMGESVMKTFVIPEEGKYIDKYIREKAQERKGWRKRERETMCNGMHALALIACLSDSLCRVRQGVLELARFTCSLLVV